MRFYKFFITHFNFIISGICFGSSVWVFSDLIQKTNEPWFVSVKIVLALICLALLALFVRSMILSNATEDKKEQPRVDFFTTERFKSSNPMICIFDLSGNYKDSNHEWNQITGLRPEICNDMGWLQIIHSDDRQKFLELWQNFLDGKCAFYLKHRLRTTDNSIKTVMSIAAPYEKDVKLFICDVTDITEANVLLNQLKDGLDHSTIIAITDDKGTITYANKAFCKISQFEEKELLGKTHRVINSGTHEKGYFKEMWNTITAGEIWVGEVCNRAKDGTLYWTHAVIIPFVNENKKPFQYLALRIEITKRKKQEILYQAISEVFQQYTGNPVAMRITKFMVEKAQAVTRSAIGFLGIKKGDSVYIYNICQAHKTGESRKFEYLSVKEDFHEANGETILGWILSQNKPFIIKENGRFPFPFGGNINNIKINSFLGIPFQFAKDNIAYLGLANSDSPFDTNTIEELEPLVLTFSQILTDIHAHEIRENLTLQIQQREKSLNTFISDLPTAIAMLDKDFNLMNYSGKWRHDYQIFESDILNKNLFEITPQLPLKWQEYIQRCQSTKETVFCEEAVSLSSGITEWMQWEIHPWIQDESIAGVMIQSQITTPEKDMQIEIEQLRYRQMLTSRMAVLGEMAGGIAHEINNPLAIISGYAERLRRLLSRGQLTEEAVNKVVTNIEQTVERITFIIKGLKAFARDGDNDPFLPNFLSKIIKDTVPFAEQKLAKNQIFLKQEPVSEEIIVECRPVQISQVILNLINNACDAIQSLEDRWVEVRVEDLENEVRILITDSGSGIPKHIAEKIMQPFFTTKEAGKGTGLGLSISKSIIESHGGVFFLEENCPHTRFVLRLPKSQSRPLSVNANEEAKSTINAWKQRLVNLLQKEQATQVSTKLCPLCAWINSLEKNYSKNPQFSELKKTHDLFHEECAIVGTEIETQRERTLQKIFQVNSSFNKTYKDLWNSITAFTNFASQDQENSDHAA